MSDATEPGETRRDINIDPLSTSDDEYLVTIDGRDGEREHQDVWSLWELEEFLWHASVYTDAKNPNKGGRRGDHGE